MRSRTSNFYLPEAMTDGKLFLQTLDSNAEGIETVEQASFLKNLSYDFGQGYYFSRPVPAIDIERMFKENHHWEL